MKKDGIQTRNRKVSNKNKKNKKAAMLESYSEVNQPSSLDDNCGPFSLGPGTLLTYSHTPHLIPTPSPLHHSATLPYTHHLNTGMVPTLVWKQQTTFTAGGTQFFPNQCFIFLGISTLACLPVICVHLYINVSTLDVMWMKFSVYLHCILRGNSNFVDIILIQSLF